MTNEPTLDIVMPQMGVSVEEGIVVKWHVAVGDRVANEQLVCEITTDKTDAEILAPADGVIAEIITAVGESIGVGMAVARMTVGDAAVAPATVRVEAAWTAVVPESFVAEDLSKVEATASSTAATAFAAVPSTPVRQEHSVVRTSNARHSRRVSEMLAGALINPSEAADAVLDRVSERSQPLSSPLARRRARERNIDLVKVNGTGRRGRICVQDVLVAARSAGASTSQHSVAGTPQVVDSAAGLPVGYEDVPYQEMVTSPHRRAISEHMRRSRQTSAHMTTEVDVDMFQVSKVRGIVNASRESVGQSRISFLSFISKVAVTVLAEYPELNATFQHERSLLWDEVNLGIAVDTPSGLVVPVIRSAVAMSTEKIADAIASLAERARARRLVPDDLRAGTFTISNPGSVGAVSAPAIINQPQVAILGIPVIVKRPWVIATTEGTDAIAVRPILRLALTFDHRAVDGAYATRYLVRVKDCLETWDASDYM